MHTIWKGAITFGLVNVPVKLHSATDDNDISFKMIHRDCGSHLNFVRSCPTCQKQLESSEIVKGFEYEKGKYVLLEKEELEQVIPESSKEIRVLHFLGIDEINPIYFQKTYYLSPDTIGVNGYQLLATAMSEAGKAALCRVSIRSRNTLAAIRVIDDCLTLTTMFYPEEIRPIEAVPNLKQKSMIDPKGMMLAQMLIAQMSKPFTAAEYRDESRDQLISYIQQKIAGQEFVIQPQAASTTVIDLMAALQASLEAIEAVKEPKKSKRKKSSKSKIEEQTSNTETA